MSTTKSLSVKAEKPQDQTSASKAQALTEAILADQTTELSKAVDDAVMDSVLYGSSMLKVGATTSATSLVYKPAMTLSGNNINTATISRMYPRMVDLNRTALETHPVFELTVEQLRAAWMLTYGSRWVCLDETTQDDYMEKVMMRLKALGELEVHNVVDQYAPMARIKL